MKVLGMLVLVILSLGLSYFFYLKQNQNQRGGKIAFSKSIWLSFCVLVWFILPIYFALAFKTSAIKYFMITLGGLMWPRGVVELIMLYKYKNWKPIYGIVHNVFTLLSLFFIAFFLYPTRTETSLIMAIAVQMSLCFEIYFAYFFHRFIGKKTQGEEAVWFAHAEDKLFKKNLFITRFANIICYGLILIYIFMIII